MNKSTIRKALFGTADADGYLARYTERLNANIGVYAGSLLTILESVMFAASFWHNSAVPMAPKVMSYAIFGVMSAVLVTVSDRTLKHKIRQRVFTKYLTVYMYAVAAYAILNTIEDFAAGEQCFTFIVFMMMDVLLFATPPLGILALVLSSYIALYNLAFSGGRLDSGSVVNFCVSGIVVLMLGCVRFRECCIGAEREQRLEHVGAHDALTGLKNRMALRSDFPTLVGRDQYVAMADLDDFKNINDTYGHNAGDTVLATYGKALTECFSEATIYRYGGDEFLFFVPRESIPSMKEQMACLRERIGAIAIDEGGTKIVVGTSVGWVVGKAESMDELREQVRSADRHLYEVKTLNKKDAAHLA